MSLFHHHQFIEAQRVFVPPQPMMRGEVDHYLAAIILFGLTTIVSRCECGAMDTTEVKGDARVEVKP